MGINKPHSLQRSIWAVGKQKTGVRYETGVSTLTMFVLVMTCIEQNIMQELNDGIICNRVPGTDFDMVFYADDTIIVSMDKTACENLLEKLERISATYGLKQNNDTCVNLNTNMEEQQKFRSGEILRNGTGIYLTRKHT